jgi:hypothetical protein
MLALEVDDVDDVDDGQEASRDHFNSLHLDSAPTATSTRAVNEKAVQIGQMYTSPPAKKPSAYKAAPRTFVTSAPQCPRCDKVGGQTGRSSLAAVDALRTCW